MDMTWLHDTCFMTVWSLSALTLAVKVVAKLAAVCAYILMAVEATAGNAVGQNLES